MLSLTENKYAILAKIGSREKHNQLKRKGSNEIISVRIINDEPTEDNDAVTIPICFKTRY